MAQTKYPISDITNPAQVTGTFADIDDDSDSDFIYSTNNSDDTCEFLLDTFTDPVSAIDHIIRWRISKADSDDSPFAPASGGAAPSYSAWLYEGTTLRATLASAVSLTLNSVAEHNYTLTSGEANTISDYTDLRVRFEFNGSGGTPSGRRAVGVFTLKMEVPDFVAGTRNRSMVIS
jgi:hypothetical protein